MAANARFEGHIVQGHVDGVATFSSVEPKGNSRILSFKVPGHLSKYISGKGSIAVNGISLTVINVNGAKFTVGIIPYTWENTTISRLNLGDKVNIEVDIIAKYLERLAKNVKKTY